MDSLGLRRCRIRVQEERSVITGIAAQLSRRQGRAHATMIGRHLTFAFGGSARARGFTTFSGVAGLRISGKCISKSFAVRPCMVIEIAETMIDCSSRSRRNYSQTADLSEK